MAKGGALDTAAKLREIVGSEHVSTDELDLICYSRDMAPMPDDLLKTYGVTPPEAVVRPGTAVEVAAILRWAADSGIPVTPRAGGSWALGGTIPVEGGVVLDLSRMDQILEVSEADGWVRVGGSVTWKRLSDVLERQGLRLGTYPSSAPSAAVAGFIATGGSGGIGASLHGPVGDQVLSLAVALTDGRVVETDPWSSWVFTGSEGTLGVICEVVLKVFPAEPMYQAMLAFDGADGGLDEAWKAFRRLYELRPYFLTFLDQGFANALNRAASSGPRHDLPDRAAGDDAHHALPEKAVAFVACFVGSEGELAKVRKEVEGAWAGALCDPELARHEWEGRFDAVLATKKLGPTIFSPEIQVPISELPAVFDELERVVGKRDHAVEGMAIGGGVVTILPVIYTDERDASDFLEVFAYTRDIVDIAYSHGGTVYGIGLHNSGHVAKVHGNGLTAMQRIRSEIEPSSVLNPSKTTQARVPYWVMRVAMSFMESMPWLVAAGLRVAGLVPRPILKFGLRVIGSQQR
jgi:FAD/FMN-containing dehydrogenase